MRRLRLLGRARHAVRAAGASRERGQIMVLFAIFMIVLLVLAGSAYDYASIVVDDAKLQNAVDAAALAGAHAMTNPTPGTTPISVAGTVTAQYLSDNGVTSSNATIAITPLPYVPPAGTPTPNPTIYDGIGVNVTKTHPTAFWPLVGLSQVNLHDGAQAHGSHSMVDVMLSLDTTGSEVLSGSFTSIQQAVGTFITTMAPSTSDARGPKIGIARFAGIRCQYDSHGNYNQGCVDDENVLTPLTNDPATLLAIANGPNNASCPSGDYNNGGCPLQHIYYNASNRATTVSASTGGSYSPEYTGTKLPNAFTVLGLSPGAGPYTFGSTYAWSTANGGRNDSSPGGANNARKVMVLMTDGQDEMWPVPGPGGSESVSTYDANVQSMANALQNGPDGTAGTYDDVDIYVVGYFCTDYPNNFCQSALAASTPHGCPGPQYPPPGMTPSTIDNLLNAIASSTPGTCDHYYPLGKDETVQDLPSLFQSLAGRISRGALTQ